MGFSFGIWDSLLKAGWACNMGIYSYSLSSWDLNWGVLLPEPVLAILLLLISAASSIGSAFYSFIFSWFPHFQDSSDGESETRHHECAVCMVSVQQQQEQEQEEEEEQTEVVLPWENVTIALQTPSPSDKYCRLGFRLQMKQHLAASLLQTGSQSVIDYPS